MNKYYTYIMTNDSKTLYTGITNNLWKRVEQHRSGIIEGFTKRYNIKKLVYFEEFNSPREAILREKQIKGWLRTKKIAFIESANKEWGDLSKTLHFVQRDA